MLLIAFGTTRAFAQTITVGSIDPGPYSQGSTITAPISVDDSGGCIAQGNTYNLYLSDASGNFSPGTLIGTYNGFYAPFVNGVIPAGTPAGTGYKLEVQSTSPAVTSSVSAAFTINAGAAVTASASSSASLAPGVFGSCINFPGETYTIAGTSAAGTTETASFYNEATGAFEGTNIAIPNTGYIFSPTASNYAVIVKATDASGNVGTYSYELINNIIRNNFGSTGNGFVCLVGGRGDLSFNIAVNGPSGISSNYPGDVYVVNWGDGTSTTFTYCQLKALGGVVTHTFTLPSCGQTQNNVVNSFFVQNQAINPYCGAITSAPGVSAKVLIQPITSFAAPAIACAGTQLTIPNTSQPGPDPNNVTTATCATNPNALYDWSLDGVPQAGYQGVPLSTSFIFPTSLTSGIHTLTLHAELPTGGGIGCVSPDYTQAICFEKAPQPSFTIPAEVCVTAGPVTPTNTSIAYNVCSAASYVWTVTGPGAVSYAGGTTSGDAQPQFVFPTAGTYTVQLGMNSGCGLITTTQTIYVDAAPTATLSADATLCGNNQTLTFDPTQTITKTTFSGTTQQQPTTYTWTVTGGAFSFAGGTNANSEYPQILFNNFATYTVKVVHQNTCGTVSATQHITFVQAPVPHAGPDQTVCASSPTATLAGSVTGVFTSYQWTGGGGTFTPNRNVLTPTYTPSASEIAAGQVTLTLQVNSSAPAPCNVATDNIIIHITPTPIVNSPPTAAVCSQQALNYAITADQPLTTFAWTASATTGSPTGFTASGSGSTITDVLINTGTADAVVTYLITPTLKTCPGSVFTLTVTVHPLPVITAAPVISPICNNNPANIALGSNVANTSYTWTSSATAGITGNTNQATPQLITSIQDILVNSGALPGTVTYTVTPYNGTCAGPPAITTITVEPSPITANPGPTDEVCNQTSYVLQGNNPSPGTGKWTKVSGPGTIIFSDPTDPNATVSGLIPGNVYQFRWTTTYDPSCPSSSKVVKITDDIPPVGGTTSSPVRVCSGTNAGQVVLSGQSGTIVRWEYSVDLGAHWLPITNTTTFQNYNDLTQTTQYRAIIHRGVCTDVPSSATQITVDPPTVVSNPGRDDEICNATSYTLQGNNPSPGTGLWTLVQPLSGPSFSDQTDPHAVVSNLVPGNIYKFQWTITGPGVCPPTFNTVTITDDLPPLGGTTSGAIHVCTGTNAGQITLSGQFGTIVRWESSTDGGASWSPITYTGTTLPYLNLTQTTQYHAILHNGVCTDVPSTPTTITVDPLPVMANAGPNQELCGITSYTLQGNNPSPGTGVWTVTGPAGVNFSDKTDPHALVTGLVPGNLYQFTWTITGAATTCPPTNNTVNIIIDKVPVGGTTSAPGRFCAGNNSGRITLTGFFGTVVRWESSIDNGTSWQTIANTTTTQPYLNLMQTTQYRAFVTNGICTEVPSTATTITIDQPPVVANAGGNAEICNATSYTLQGNDPSPGTGLWSVIGPAGYNFSDKTDPHAVVTGLIPGSVYKFTWTISASGNCPSNGNTATITDDLPPVGGTTSAPNSVCAGNNSGLITLGGQFGNVVRWESSIDGGANWVPITNVTTVLAYSNLTQTTQFRAIVHHGVCTDVPSSATIITVNQPPVTSNPGPADEVCNVTSYTLQGNAPSPATGVWSVSGPAGVNFSDKTDPHALVTGLIPGNAYQFTWTIRGLPGCSSSANSVTITIDQPPVGGTTSGGTTVCISGNGGQITLAGQFGSVVRWESSVDGGATWLQIANTNTTLPYLNLTQTTEYRAIIHHSNTCTDVASSITTITVAPLPIPASAGLNDEVCGVTTYALQGNNPAPGTGKWTQVAGPAGAKFSNPASSNAVVSGLIPGNTYQFEWTISTGGGCPSNSSPVTIIVDKRPVGGTATATPSEVCFGSNAGKVVLTGQFGTIFGWQMSTDGGATWTAIGNSTSIQTFTNLTKTTRYRAILHNGNICADVYSTPALVVVDPMPVLSNPGPDATVCSVTSYTLHGNNPAPGIGTWSQVPAPTAGVNISDIHDPNATVTGLTPGNIYQFQWSIISSPTSVCPPSNNTVNITIDQEPVGGTTAGANEVCPTSNSGQITLSGQFGAIVRWESSVDGGAHWATINNTSASQPYLNLTQTTAYRVLVHNGTCPDVYSTVTTIVVDPPPVTANAGPGANLCNITTYTLQGNNPAPWTGEWKPESGPTGVMFSDPTDPHAVVTGLIPGNIYQFRWTIHNSASCGDSYDIVTINIGQPPVGGTASGTTSVCAGSNSGTIALSGQFGTVLRWESSIDNGLTWQPIANTNPTQTYLNLMQTTQYRAIVHNSANCPDATSTVAIITVDTPPPVADAGEDDRLCGVTSYMLNGNHPSPGTGLWKPSLDPTGVSFSDPTDPNATVSGLVPGNTYQFEWTISSTGSCPGSHDFVTIIIDKAPVGGTTSGADKVCIGDNSGKILLSGQFGTIIRWEFSTDNGNTWQPIGNTGPTQQYTNLTQTTEYRAILHNGAICTDVPSSVTTITVVPPPVTSVPGPDDRICNATTYTLHANNPAPGTGMWTPVQPPTSVSFSDPTDPNATVSGLIPGNVYRFNWEITGTGHCKASDGVVTITDEQPPVGGATAGAVPVCFGDNNGQITLSGQFGTIVRWESSIDNGNTWQPIANSTTVLLYSNLTRTTEYRAILHNGTACTDAPSTPTTIIVNPATPLAYAGPDFSVCNQTIITLTGNAPGTAGGFWDQAAGPPVHIADPTNFTTQVTGLSGDNIYAFRWTIYGLPPCNKTESIVHVTLHTDVIPSFVMDQSNGCGPTVVTFTNTSTPLPNGTFVWNFGDGSPSVTAVNPPPHSFIPSSDGTEITYYVSLTPTSNCGSQTPFIAPVTVSPATPMAAILPGPVSSCGTINLTVKNISPGDNLQYDFYLLDPGGAVVQRHTYPDKQDAVFASVSPTQPTNYQLYMIVTDKCGNQARTPTVIIPGAPSSVTSQLQIKGTPSICLGQQVTFQNISTGGDTFTITIYDANKNPILPIPTGTNDLDYTPTKTGTFYASITAGYASCGNAPPSALVPFVVYPVPEPAFSYTADENYNVTFVNTTPDAGGIPAPSLLYEWNFGDGSPHETSYIPTSHHYDFAKSPFTVTLKATTPGSDCFNIATQIIDVSFHGNIFVPNAIMPSNPQKELNTFMVKGYGLKKWHIQIFNNFGQLIWESTKLDSNGSPTEGWDGTYKGKIVEQGVYIWQVSGILLNGEPWKGMSYNGSAPSLVGPIHVIR